MSELTASQLEETSVTRLLEGVLVALVSDFSAMRDAAWLKRTPEINQSQFEEFLLLQENGWGLGASSACHVWPASYALTGETPKTTQSDLGESRDLG
jgi:hypothetical protein